VATFESWNSGYRVDRSTTALQVVLGKDLSKTYEALHFGSWFAWRERRERYKRLGSVSPQFALSWSRLTNKPFYT